MPVLRRYHAMTRGMPRRCRCGPADQAFGSTRGQLPESTHPAGPPPGVAVQPPGAVRLLNPAPGAPRRRQCGTGAAPRPRRRPLAASRGQNPRGLAADGGSRGGRVESTTSLPVPSLRSLGTPYPAAPVEAQPGNRTEVQAICLFKKQNYKISSTVGQKRALMSAITPVLDSGAGPKPHPFTVCRRVVATIDKTCSESSAHQCVKPRDEGARINALSPPNRCVYGACLVPGGPEPCRGLYPRYDLPGSPRQGDPPTAKEVCIPRRANRGVGRNNALEARPQDVLEEHRATTTTVG